jgi:hypothetical protein
VAAFFSTMVDINSTSALIVASVCPGNFLILPMYLSIIVDNILHLNENAAVVSGTLRYVPAR